MNKPLVFVLGLLTGVAAGSGATYYILHDRLVADAQDEIERYAEHCEERIASIRAKYAGNQPDTEAEELTDDEDLDNRDDALIRRNEGVKKYHHQEEYIGNANANTIFAKEEKEVTDLEKEVKDVKGVEDDPMIEEINEEIYLEDDGEYEKELIDFVYPEEKGYWGYGTDNELEVQQKFGGKGMFALIGQSSRWLMDYFDENLGIGEAYFRNKHLMTDFHVVIHDNSER